MNQKIMRFFKKNKMDLMVIFMFLAVLVFQYVRTWGFFLDDSFITLRYAQNILLGNGWVFSPGEFYNSATSVLAVIQFVILGFLFGVNNLEVIGFTIYYFWLFGIALMIWFYLKRYINKFAAVSVGLSLIMGTHFYFSFGIEATLNVFLFVAALVAYDQKMIKTLMTIFALLILTRFENGIFVAIFFLYLFGAKKYSFKKLFKYGLYIIGPLIIWFIYSYKTFGELMPSTLDAKVWQGGSNYYWGSGYIYLKGLWGYVHLLANSWRVALGVGFPDWVLGPRAFINILKVNTLFADAIIVNWILIFGGLYYALKKRLDGLLLLTIFVGIHTLLYGLVFNVPLYPWYASLAILIWFIFTYLGISAFLNKIFERKFSNFLIPIICLIFLAPVFFVFQKPVEATIIDVRTEPYRDIAEWINSNIPEDAVIFHEEIGEIGFLTQRRTVDTIALTSPQYLDYLKKKNFRWWMDYITNDSYFVSYKNIYPMDETFLNAMLVYEKESALDLKLFKLDTEKFVLPQENQQSIFALDYETSGPASRQGTFSRVLLNPENKMCNAIFLHAQRVDEGGGYVFGKEEAQTKLTILEFPNNYSKLSFYALIAQEALESESDGAFIDVFIYYKNDLDPIKKSFEFRPDGMNYKLITTELKDYELIEKIEIVPFDVNNAYDWLYICDPVFED